jgi:translation initiation factor 2D
VKLLSFRMFLYLALFAGSLNQILITRIDPKHPSIENHGPHSTIAEEELKASKKAAREALSDEGGNSASGSGAKGKGKEIVIEEMWKPSSTSLQFWEACGVE